MLKLVRMFPSIALALAFVELLMAAAKPEVEPLPLPVANNAVASLKVQGRLMLFSFMGIGSKKTWDSVTNNAYSLDTDTGKWLQMRSVPGTAGRIGAVAVSVRETVVLLGGSVIDPQAGLLTVPDANVYEPLTDRWYRPEDIPVRVADSVAGAYRNRYVYLISGRSRNEPVKDVQLYDAEKNVWKAATPIPGSPVFGHAGGLIGDRIIYVDGAYRNPAGTSPPFIASDECWMGQIDHHDPTKIQWTKLPNHPGPARFRIVAGASEKDNKVYFSGGSDTPYDYHGQTYDGKPAVPSPVVFAYDLRANKWSLIGESTPNPTMDQRGLIVLPSGLVLLGGMDKDQQVLNRVIVLPKQAKTQ